MRKKKPHTQLVIEQRKPSHAVANFDHLTLKFSALDFVKVYQR